MVFTKPSTPITKGKLRCFDCRQPCLIKGGSWHADGSQQVFLCAACEKSRRDLRMLNHG